MQQGDYNSPYYQHYHHPPPPPPPHLQNPSSIDLQQQQPNPLPTTTYASAPPFTPNYSSSSDYPTFSSPYPPPYSHNPDPSFPPAPDPLPETQSPYPYYPPYDHHQTPPNSGPSSIPPTFSASYTQLGSSLPQPHHMYESSYESGVKFDHGSGSGGYIDEGSSRYGRTRSDLGLDFYDRRSENAYYDRGGGGVRDDGLGGDGVYAYDGGRMEPYGARGTTTTTTVSKSSTWSSSAFDDYGRSLSIPSVGKDQLNSGSPKIVRAVPKVETETDVKNGVQKFRVKLLPEGSTQGTMDVLCQIGLDGIRMLDPNTSRTLRIYPLETLTRWEANSSIFNFWSKSSVDIEPRRIRLQSNSYTTNTILDTVTAATVQMKEMGEGFKPSDSVKTSDQPSEKKKGFPDWMNLMKPGNEEKDHWVPDEAVSKCTACGTDFNAFVRKHHCRNCGDIYCDKCTHGRIALTADENAQPVRVCDRCMAEVTQRLSSAKESASKHAGLHSHEDLAKKLQEVMDRNRKASSGSKSDGSGRRMREVACPTCTVHLQVQVPSSGSETIECGVCQHPFLVSAN